MVLEVAVALGIDLHLLSADEGGRRTAILGTKPFAYRPNWGLPWWPENEQSGAPVLCFSKPEIAPGQQARAVIVPVFPELLSEWQRVRPGDLLRMFEGACQCGTAVVLWSKVTSLPLPAEDAARFRAWACAEPSG